MMRSNRVRWWMRCSSLGPLSSACDTACGQRACGKRVGGVLSTVLGPGEKVGGREGRHTDLGHLLQGGEAQLHAVDALLLLGVDVGQAALQVLHARQLRPESGCNLARRCLRHDRPLGQLVHGRQHRLELALHDLLRVAEDLVSRQRRNQLTGARAE